MQSESLDNAGACPYEKLSRTFELSNAQLEALYGRMHDDQKVVYLDDIDYWAVCEYGEIRRILSDQETFSPEIALQPFQPLEPETLQLFMEGGVSPTRIMVDNPGPNHKRARQIVQQSFTPDRLAKLVPDITALVDDAIDGFIDDGKADLIDQMLYELPALVLFKLLGVPDGDVKNIKRWADNRLLFTWGRLSREEQINAAREMVDYWAYCRNHVRKKEQDPGDDMPSFLLNAKSDDGEELSTNEIIDIMFGVLLAGHETTTNQSANTILSLLEKEGAWRSLAEDASKIPNTVEEGLRFRPSVVAWRRKTMKDVEISGVEVPAGANLLVFLAAANRDESLFGVPDDFDLERQNARQHISFGYGPHFCLGAPLARLEMKIILERLTQRIPTMRLKSEQSLDPIKTVQFRGPLKLLVEWDA